MANLDQYGLLTMPVSKLMHEQIATSHIVVTEDPTAV